MVYNLLIEVGGATPAYKEDFVQFHAKRHSPEHPECAFTTEFRFGGHFGMGGKLWVDLDGFRVRYYSEDENEDRRRIRADLDKRLKPLFLQWHRLCEGGGERELIEEERAELLESGVSCHEFPFCEEEAAYFDEGDFAWCTSHGPHAKK